MQKFLLMSKYFYLLITALIIFVPLYPKFPLLGVGGTFVAIRLEDVLILLVFLFWFLLNIKKIKSYLHLRIFQIFILFFAVGLLSVISGVFITFTTSLGLGLLHLVRRVEYMGLFLIAATMIRSLDQVKVIFYALIGVAIVVVLYGFGQIYLNFPVVSTNNSEFSKGLILYLTQGARVNSTFAGHYDLAVFLSLILTTLASFFFYYKKLYIKALIVLQGIISFVLLGLTAGRISFVASIFGIAFVFWLNKKKILILGLFLMVLVSLVAIPELRHRLVATLTVNVIGGGGPKYSPAPGTITEFTPINQIPESDRERVLKERAEGKTSTVSGKSGAASDAVAGEPINSTELGVYRSFGIRLDVEWPRAVNSFYKNPLLGTGYSSITLATDNDVLRSLGETGLLGILALALIFFTILKRFKNYISSSIGFEKFYTVAMFSNIVVILITGTFIDVLEASKIAEIFWLLLGVGWAICSNYKINDET